jgi:DNA-binding GntR family transcriptional regulator
MSEQKDLVSQLVLFLHLRHYEPGERVPSERELAERFKVSRGQIREALSYLEALRIIERRAKSGIYMALEAASVEALALFAQVGAPLSSEESSPAPRRRWHRACRSTRRIGTFISRSSRPRRTLSSIASSRSTT